ncbi:YciI-like protein [Sphingomonas sp. KR3-1]|uniref:YciI-like protein n=1 Tax=Sphingomonas sp. KR3-1 TaxID=3156611 RepID=UPI0032B429D0
MHWLLRYTTAPDYLARRAAFRDAHLRLAWASVETGALLLGGAVGDPPESALLLFASEAAARAFAASDPYVANGLVTHWEVLPWNTVVGDQAANPVRPAA